jgi:hypothetical protein
MQLVELIQDTELRVSIPGLGLVVTDQILPFQLSIRTWDPDPLM